MPLIFRTMLSVLSVYLLEAEPPRQAWDIPRSQVPAWERTELGNAGFISDERTLSISGFISKRIR